LFSDKHPLDVFCINETFPDAEVDDSEIHIPGYRFIKRDRRHNMINGLTGGGVSIYINEKIPYTVRTDLVMNDSFECIWLELNCKGHKPFLISSIYRPPSANIHYYDTIMDSIENASLEDKELYISGVLNWDYKIDES
jgi:hypothetical protein